MSEIIPTNQNTSINHSENRVFDFNNVNSRFYLGQTANNVLRVFGGDCVIDGLEVLSYSINGNILSFTVSKGTAIIDGTQIDFQTDNTITLDTTGLDHSSGYIVLSISFVYLFVSKQNEAKLHCTYITNDNIAPDYSWYVDRNHLVLDKFNYNTSEQTLTKVANPEFDPLILTIHGKEYEVRKRSVIEKRVKRLVGFIL
jgi:hypothetical protein